MQEQVVISSVKHGQLQGNISERFTRFYLDGNGKQKEA